MTKSKRITRHFVKNPTASVKEAALKFGVSVPYAYALRKKAMHEAQEELSKVILGPQTDEIVVAMAPTANDRQVGGDHYKSMGVQPWDVVDTWPRDQRIGYYRGGALKYLMRMGSKDESPMEVAKGQHYIQKLLEVLHEQQSNADNK